MPYDDLVRTNRARSRQEFEYELIDSGIFDDDQYFDVFAEYDKASAEDILILLTVHNRGSATKPLHLLPTLWYTLNKVTTTLNQERPADIIGICRRAEHFEKGRSK